MIAASSLNFQLIIDVEDQSKEFAGLSDSRFSFNLAH